MKMTLKELTEIMKTYGINIKTQRQEIGNTGCYDKCLGAYDKGILINSSNFNKELYMKYEEPLKIIYKFMRDNNYNHIDIWKTPV